MSQCNFHLYSSEYELMSSVSMKYRATSSVAKASAKHCAAALYSEIVKVRTSERSEGEALRFFSIVVKFGLLLICSMLIPRSICFVKFLTWIVSILEGRVDDYYNLDFQLRVYCHLYV